MLPLALGLVILVGAMAAAGVPARGQTPKRGGILNAMLAEDLPGFSIHESATISAVWPVAPCYSNLVPHHSLYNYGRMQEVWLDR